MLPAVSLTCSFARYVHAWTELKQTLLLICCANWGLVNRRPDSVQSALRNHIAVAAAAAAATSHTLTAQDMLCINQRGAQRVAGLQNHVQQQGQVSHASSLPSCRLYSLRPRSGMQAPAILQVASARPAFQALGVSSRARRPPSVIIYSAPASVMCLAKQAAVLHDLGTGSQQGA